MRFCLQEDALCRTLLAAHRGSAGGNIPCNTLSAFEAALAQGADMIELDVAHSSDGELFIFHPGMEKAHLDIDRRLSEMTAQEIRRLRFVNTDRVPTQQKISTFDEAMELLKGRCYINVDKFWENIEPVTTAIRRHGMADQVLVKTSPDEEVIRRVEEIAPDLNYMLILRDEDTYSERMLGRKLRYVGAEVLFEREDAPVASPEYIHRMNERGLLVWANAIVYNYKAVLAAGHSDDTAVSGHPDEGWGWLVRRGFNIIQTDWPMMLRAYMQQM